MTTIEIENPKFQQKISPSTWRINKNIIFFLTYFCFESFGSLHHHRSLSFFLWFFLFLNFFIRFNKLSVYIDLVLRDWFIRNVSIFLLRFCGFVTFLFLFFILLGYCFCIWFSIFDQHLDFFVHSALKSQLINHVKHN